MSAILAVVIFESNILIVDTEFVCSFASSTAAAPISDAVTQDGVKCTVLILPLAILGAVTFASTILFVETELSAN